MSVQRYNFDVTSVLKPLGTPRGEVYFGTELELEVSEKLPKAQNTRNVDAEDINAIPLEDLEECAATGCTDCVEILARRRGQDAPKAPEVTSIKTFSDLVSAVESSIQDFAILKDDGSLDSGFEIVTCPASLTMHRKRWAKFFANSEALGFLQAKSTCGMHVHISKEPLSVEMRGNMHMFVNDPANTNFIRKIAGRSSNTYSKYIPKPKTEIEFPKEKYEAVNLIPKKTVEIRIFASTTDSEVLYKNLEFCAALVHWVQTQKIEDPKLVDFLAGVDRNRKSYPSLVKFLESEKEL